MSNPLAKDLRNLLARATVEARDTAEQAARSALENLAVHEKDYRPHMSAQQRQLRNRLRERGRALGDTRDERSGRQDIRHLTEDVAYEHWHRLLFTRFLAENGFLRTNEAHGNVPITVAECDELAAELGARDGFELACRFASEILPGVFRPNDPVLELTLAVEDQVKLRKLLDSLSREVFVADDSLGWTYQFWQAKRKDEVNTSGNKVGADELPPVTQLFTEDYMVEFLLHNTLGAWWAGKVGPIKAEGEAQARAKAALPVRAGLGVKWTYLRFIQDGDSDTWIPSPGIFHDWPSRPKDISLLDPCMGSGHFLICALPILVRLRMEDETLSAPDAVYAVLRDNLYGLELDRRCAQIAAFNLALTAWKLGGYQTLPSLHLACSGVAPSATEKQWVAFAAADERLRRGMTRLHSLFNAAPVLGSLINPTAGEPRLLEADYHELQPLIDGAFSRETDDAAVETAVIARGLAKAAEILATQFTLVATNVPYLGRGKQDEALQNYCERAYPDAKADLATCFVRRCLEFCAPHGSAALVNPQNWLFMGTYAELRRRLIDGKKWDFVARLGPKGFQTPMWDFNIVLICLTNRQPDQSAHFMGIDVAAEASPAEKQGALVSAGVASIAQAAQRQHPDCRILLTDVGRGELFAEVVDALIGFQNGDSPRFIINFWEVSDRADVWEWLQSTTSTTTEFFGCDSLLRWENGHGAVTEIGLVKGREAWGKRGVCVRLMGELPCSLYFGHFYDQSSAAVVPKNPKDLDAVWAFCSSDEFSSAVREVDQALKVTNATLTKIPFDLDRWRTEAKRRYPNGLPKPCSKDPTQWLFNGSPKDSDQPLHVAVSRLLGYVWPRQSGSVFPDAPGVGRDGLEAHADDDGIVCLPAISREQTAAHRLRTLLMKALGKFDERALLAGAGSRGSKSATLEEWLRDEFFEQHCDLFHQRPFIWHVWDGRKDGFHALVNYHKLDHATLQKLTYSYLGDWIRHQEQDAKADRPGADARLGAARILQKALANILEGEAPYDIFVRWKALSEQSIGWHPDVNDGVRLNIRPFVTADLLRKHVRIKWEKDRGREPQRDKNEYAWFWCETEPGTDPEPGRQPTGHRWNDVHLTIQRKRLARKR